MDLLKLLKKHPKDLKALQDAGLNISVRQAKDKTWQAMTWTQAESKQLNWSNVGGYESPRRAVLHAARAGVEARMSAAKKMIEESANVQS